MKLKKGHIGFCCNRQSPRKVIIEKITMYENRKKYFFNSSPFLLVLFMDKLHREVKRHTTSMFVCK